MTERLFDVFLAHNSVDKPQVRTIATKLRERGLKPWLDEEQIPPGKSFQDEIQKAIPQIKAAAIVIGTTGLGKWQIQELRLLMSQFVDRKSPVIPVLLPGVDNIPGDLLFLQELHRVQFEQIDDPRAFYMLEWGITEIKPEFPPETEQSTAEEMTEQLSGALLAPNSSDTSNNTQLKSEFSKSEFISTSDNTTLVILIMSIIFGGIFYSIVQNFGLISSVLWWIFLLIIFIFVMIFTWALLTPIMSSDESKPDDVPAPTTIADLAKNDLEDKKEVIVDYNQAIEVKPDDTDFYNNSGNDKDDLGDKQEEIADYNQAAQPYVQEKQDG